MKRLRHPIRSITEPFGKAGLIVAVLALAMAMVGGAYAATKLNGTQKKEVEKIAKKFAGKPGAAGAQGAPGAQGPAGPAGKDGSNGTNGTNGATGKSVEVGAAAEAECEKGGATVQVAGEPATKQAICNGEPGVIHRGETLAPEATETGAWSAIAGEAPAGLTKSPVTVASFPIPLSAPVGEAQVHYINAAGKEVIEGLEEVEPTKCGSGIGPEVNAENPQAEPGNLCIYAAVESGFVTYSGDIFRAGSSAFERGAGTAGAIMYVQFSSGGHANGTWAVSESE